MEKKLFFAIALIIVSGFVLVYKLLLPVKVQIVIEGSAVEVVETPALYHLSDAVVIATMALLMGASGVYLLIAPPIRQGQTSSSLEEASTDRWKFCLESLTDQDEHRLYQLIIEEGGVMFQGELVDKSGFSKSKVSIVLDRLEARNLLERRRHGMSNVVVLR